MTSATEPKTISLGGNTKQREAIAGGAITPGMLLALNSSAQVIAHNLSGQEGVVGYAVEYDLTGRGISDAYAQGDQVIYRPLEDGDVFYGIVVDGQDISVGEALASDGTGKLKSAAATDMVYGYALDAVSPSGSDARCRVQVARGRGIS